MRRLAISLLMVAACDSKSSEPADLALPADLAMGPKAMISATPDVVGFVTRLDGSASLNAAKYTWHFAQVPPASVLTDSAFSTTTGPTPTFDPDLGGVYRVQLTVTAADGTTDTTLSEVTVPTLPVFYHEAVFPTPGPASFAVGVVRSDGTGAHRISCAVTSNGPGDLGGDDLFDLLEVPGLLSMRVFDATLSLVAFEQVEAMISGNTRTLKHTLWLADENSDCSGKPPVRLDDDTQPSVAKLGPRFSPDGTRLAYQEGNRLVTVGVDGKNQHVVRTGKLIAAPPAWIDATHVAWVEDLSPTPSPHPAIESGADMDSTTPATQLDCGNLAVINQFERLSDGTWILAGGVTSKLQGGSITLYRVTTDCKNPTVLVTPGVSGDAWDFAISPDEKSIALSSSVVQAAAPAPQHDLYIAASDGSSTPTRFSASDPLYDDVGPRWLASGRQISWTQAARPPDGGVSSGAGVSIANLNGSHQRSLKAETGTTVLVAPANRGLACDLSTSGEIPAILVILIGCLVFWRRSTTH
jgi:hypothetical protein